jgi:pyruvate/2-oxoglutarate dehydrogenase complex dihydrolipoamide dehydrogenase (E3) component
VTVDAAPGTPVVPDLAGAETVAAVPADDVLTDRVDLDAAGHRVAVVGPGLLAGETALLLAAAGKRVTLVVPGDRAMADAHPLVAGTTAHRLAGHGGRTVTGVTPRRIVDGHLEVDGAEGPGSLGPVDLLVWAVGWAPGERAPLVVGDTWDAFAQRLLVHGAARLARQL